MRWKLPRAEYIERLKIEYTVIEEAARLLREIIEVLPESRGMASFGLSYSGVLKTGLSDNEFRKVAREALIRELLEYLETELSPPPRPRPWLVK